MIIDNIPLMSASQLAEAPFNQREPEEMDFCVTCSQSLSKTVVLKSSNYIPTSIGVDTTNTDWGVEYENNEYHTPLQLISLFKRYLQDEIEHSGIAVRNEDHMRRLMEECDNWIDDDTEYIEDTL